MAYFVFIAVFSLFSYVYFSWALMRIAQRLNVANAWLAWIPVANLVLMAKMAKMHWWPVLLLLTLIIPFINFIGVIVFGVFMTIWVWKICEARKRPGWWALLALIPLFGSIWQFVMFGILAWGKD